LAQSQSGDCLPGDAVLGAIVGDGLGQLALDVDPDDEALWVGYGSAHGGILLDDEVWFIYNEVRGHKKEPIFDEVVSIYDEV
jgi:hypothetical protein